MNQIQGDTYRNDSQATETYLYFILIFIQQVTQGFLFILFSTQYYGSHQCIYLKNYSLIYGIILIPDSILTLQFFYQIRIWNVYKQKKQYDLNDHFVTLRALSFFFNSVLYAILISIVIANEDCGELRIFAIIFILISLIYFISFYIYTITQDDEQEQNNQISNDFN